jgi:hypothetical protein
MERLKHVLNSHPEIKDMAQTSILIKAMLEDVVREGKGEFENNKDVEKAIRNKTVELWKTYLRERLEENK